VSAAPDPRSVILEVTQRGESTWYEGVQLLAIYIVLGLTFYFV